MLPLLLGSWGMADALDILKNIMPGKVAKAHAKYEGKCLKCHDIFQKEFFNKCLACHKEVKKDVEEKKGFHGRIDASRCETCHTEHQGRNHRLILFDLNRFDHQQTDFPLTGKHSDLTCSLCHIKPKFRETPHACFSCHKKDDTHKGGLGKECELCHNANDWTNISFDHSKTRFPLKGKHQKVTCEECHTAENFKNTPTKCIACHRKDDKHKGILGTKCEVCHIEKSWKQETFDHNKTRFKLVGKHQNVDCLKCHTTPKLKETPKTCYGCHKEDDKHKGKAGTKCGVCHRSDSWKKIRFDHSTTQYPLRGKHLRVSCTKCHPRDRYKVPSNCVSCHRKDDVHKRELGTICENCHTERKWKDIRSFDHQKTNFPLLWKHIKVRCAKCHKTQMFKDTSSICYDCHKKDDYHKGKFGKKCGSCHNEKTWERSNFDHERETGYPLVGKHKGIKCEQCHTQTLFVQKTSRTCIFCHRRDDVHNGELGTMCSKCHTEEGF